MRSVLLAALLFFGAHISFASATEPVSSFEKIISHGKNAVDQTTLVYFNSGKSTWLKRKYTVSNMKYDVRKTDSLISPVIGVVTLDLIVEASHPFQTKDEADVAVDYNPKFKIINDVTLNYAFTSGNWVFKGGLYKPLLVAVEKKPQFTFPISPDKLQPETESVHWAVIRFLP